MRQRQRVGKRGEVGGSLRREVSRDYEDLGGYTIQTHPVGLKSGFMFFLDRERSEGVQLPPFGWAHEPSGVDTLSSAESRKAKIKRDATVVPQSPLIRHKSGKRADGLRIPIQSGLSQCRD